MKSKKMTAVGLAVGLVAGAGAGLILEMSGSAGASSAVVSQETDQETDAGTDTTASQDREARHSERLAEVLQPLVDDGTLTDEQMDAVVETLVAAGPVGGHGRGGHGRGGHGISVVAETLGLTAEEIRAAIESGQTIADLAAANGSSGDAVIDAMVAEVSAHLAEKVAAGDLTQEEADAKLAEATERITEFVNNTPEPPEGGRRGGADA